MIEVSPDTDYLEEKECYYKGEHYSVRDNGAVFRHHREGKRLRKDDDFWTFGTKNNVSGYKFIGSERVHIIVATAFYGPKESKIYVVDHIDTNRCNNRKENLRWLTRLENALGNPITRKRIEFLVGDIQKFIDDPSCLRDVTGSNQDIMWMRTVSSEEARNSYNRMMEWAQKRNEANVSRGGRLDEWIFSPETKSSQDEDQIDSQDDMRIEIVSITGKKHFFTISDSIDSIAIQGNWTTPTNFLCCPHELSHTPIEDYYSNLRIDKVFCRSLYGESKILDFAISKDKQHLWVLSKSTDEEAIKPWLLAEIIMYKNSFLHLNRHSFFTEVGGRKYFILAQGKEWTGGDCIDDYC